MVPAADVVDTAIALAERIAANGPLGLAATKQLVRLSITDPDAVDERRAEWQQRVFSSEDAQEGAMAFIEKRDPVWRGR